MTFNLKRNILFLKIKVISKSSEMRNQEKYSKMQLELKEAKNSHYSDYVLLKDKYDILEVSSKSQEENLNLIRKEYIYHK